MSVPATAATAIEPARPVEPASPVELHALLEVVGHDQPVPLVQGGSARYVNLDYAASAPALRAVADHLAQVLPYYSSVHRGAGHLSQISTALYEAARRDVGAFVGARREDVVIFTRNTTDSLNLLASAVPGDVVVLDIEHHANLLPWQRHGARVVLAQSTIEATIEALERQLRLAPTALVAVTGASNVSGETLPLARLATLAHRYGARIAVDGAQLVPHRRVDIEAEGVDYIAFSGHKIYAPFGAGVLIGARDWLDAAPPYLAGGGAVRRVEVDRTQWADAPARHEAGTPNLIGATALAAAVRTLAQVDPEALARHESGLRDALTKGLADLGITPLRIWSDGSDPLAIVTFVVPGYSAEQVAAFLSAEHGIGVRDGRFCAHPLLQRLTGGASAVRASFGTGSSTADVYALLAALRQLLVSGPQWHYAEEAGGIVPSPETRSIPGWLGSADSVLALAAEPCRA